MLLFLIPQVSGQKESPVYLDNGVILFWIGFAFDVSGILAIWATIVVRKGIEPVLVKFHRYSLFVWLVCLIPYFGGMYLAMNHRRLDIKINR